VLVPTFRWGTARGVVRRFVRDAGERHVVHRPMARWIRPALGRPGAEGAAVSWGHTPQAQPRPAALISTQCRVAGILASPYRSIPIDWDPRIWAGWAPHFWTAQS